MIRVLGLVKTHRDGARETRVLDGIDLAVAEGELVVLTGRSGAGKTTLLAILGGLDSRYQGSVRVGGVDLASVGERGRSQFRASRLGFVFQAHNLLPRLSAVENVRLPALFSRLPAPPAARAQAALAAVGLEALASAPSEHLSGGESQRVAIARALFLEPRLLLCDEPTGNLDEETAATIAALFFRLRSERRLTVLIASHDPGLWAGADRTLRLEGGRLSAS
ncbi:MAG: ABC transporter ATP-binding protein [Myxococcales bacterium]